MDLEQEQKAQEPIFKFGVAIHKHYLEEFKWGYDLADTEPADAQDLEESFTKQLIVAMARQMRHFLRLDISRL